LSTWRRIAKDRFCVQITNKFNGLLVKFSSDNSKKDKAHAVTTSAAAVHKQQQQQVLPIILFTALFLGGIPYYVYPSFS
jgi:hypothetical protein